MLVVLHFRWLQLLYDQDRAMYYAAEDVPCTSRTTTLNEELGQVLGIHVMLFVCYFDGSDYGGFLSCRLAGAHKKKGVTGHDWFWWTGGAIK